MIKTSNLRSGGGCEDWQMIMSWKSGAGKRGRESPASTFSSTFINAKLFGDAWLGTVCCKFEFSGLLCFLCLLELMRRSLLVARYKERHMKRLPAADHVKRCT